MRERSIPLRLAVIPMGIWTFLTWYFVEKPAQMTISTWQYIRAFAEIFSFGFLIRTFFSPWKSIVDSYPTKGFQIGLIAQTFVLNTTSRLIGAIFRTVAFAIGLAFEIILLTVCAAFIVSWLILPGIILASLHFLTPIL
jgi:hypothetical protein